MSAFPTCRVGAEHCGSFRRGDHVIHETALEIKAELIVLTTEGRNGFLDALRGSHSERILSQSPCPLLAIPASGFMASVM